MKRAFALMLTLVLASTANGKLSITVDGVVDPADEVLLEPGQEAVIGIHNDDPDQRGLTVYLHYTGPATYDLPGEIAHCEVCSYALWSAAPIWESWPGLIQILLAESSPTSRVPVGIVADGIVLHCEGEGDVTLTLLDSPGPPEWGYVFDSQTIHQGTEAPLIAEAEFTRFFCGESSPGSECTINPTAPTTADVITFSGLTGAYSNPCWFQLATHCSSPTLTIDRLSRTIEMWFQGQEGVCPSVWDPLYAPIEGRFGPLSPGDWRFFSDDLYTTFSIEFTVYSGQLFVNAADGNDTNNGIFPETAFATIQKAIDIANDGDIITVAPGTYTEDINFLGKNITLTGTGPTNSTVVKATTIDGSVTFRGTEDPNCTLTGFNINGWIAGYDWQLDPTGENHTHATISHCILENIETGCGQLIYACDGKISHCLIANISYMCLRPSPVPQIVACHGLIKNCTMANMHDGIEISPGGTCTIENCVFYRSSPIIVWAEATLNISYCNIERDPYGIIGDGTVNWGPGNIETDPCFADVATWDAEGDYHLKSQAGRWDPSGNPKSEIRNSKLGEGAWIHDKVTSLCIDAGDPMTPINFEPFPNGGIVNMGAYGGTPEASKSYFGKPPCETIIAGDVNGDCRVNFKDFMIMALHWCEDNNP